MYTSKIEVTPEKKYEIVDPFLFSATVDKEFDSSQSRFHIKHMPNSTARFPAKSTLLSGILIVLYHGGATDT
jgi:hypothetical protein